MRAADPRNQLNTLVINMLRVTGATKKHPAKQRGKQIPGPYPGFEGTAAGINALRRLGRSREILRVAQDDIASRLPWGSVAWFVCEILGLGRRSDKYDCLLI